jgi:hypothetical protein
MATRWRDRVPCRRLGRGAHASSGEGPGGELGDKSVDRSGSKSGTKSGGAPS